MEMKEITSESDERELRDVARGCAVRLWMYQVSHRRFAIHLSWSDNDAAIVLVAVGCSYIQGPFAWSAAQIECVSGGHQPRVIRDGSVGFELRCATIVMLRGTCADFAASPHDFLGWGEPRPQ